MDPRFPLTVYYAFRQDDEGGDPDEDDPNAVDLTTGWETLLSVSLESSGGLLVKPEIALKQQAAESTTPAAGPAQGGPVAASTADADR
jgi:hypothetical protein